MDYIVWIPDTYIYTYMNIDKEEEEEMSIKENEKIELFDKFYNWLKDDGLKASKSERLHRKKIFSSLLNNNKMTLDNFNDFLVDTKKQEIKNLQYSVIKYENQLFTIDQVIIDNSRQEFILKDTSLNMNLKSKFVQLEEIRKLIINKSIN